MAEPELEGVSAEERKLAVPAAAPRHAELMKAVLERESFSDPNWVFERKLDGIRCLAVREHDEVRMLSRNDLDLGGRYPEIRDAVAAQEHRRFAIDGEIVAFDGPQTSFAKLAARGHAPVPVFFYIFDLLWVDGHDIRALGLRTRKRVLRAALEFRDPLRWTSHRNEVGEAMFTEACRKGWEGVVAKRADSPYRAARSRDWLKLKCEAGQELVIGGFTAPQGSRTDFGALLLGYFRDGELQYAGKVGTGFDQEQLDSLGRRLRALRRDTSPFAKPSQIKERAVTWVAPELVGQIGFTEWTSAGRLRHPRFQGLREDKAAAEVVRER
ncbi:MAG TPA: non-homologous end-joining DNA ligase [Solirubrobacteraceae bacterium]|jgi:bifunctional non-homologous end joining protein LigD|nr:non-homologous end-joining DNA ligase [Solirubrobacteraceae bacterium]